MLLEQDMEGCTPIDVAIGYGGTDQLLGLKLPLECREDLGEEWWTKNEDILSGKSQLHSNTAEADIDIF